MHGLALLPQDTVSGTACQGVDCHMACVMSCAQAGLHHTCAPHPTAYITMP